MTNGSIYKFAIHQSVLFDVSFIVFAIEVSSTIDVGDSTASCRGTPDKNIGSCKIVQQPIRVMLRGASYSDIENNTEFIVSLLKSILAHIVF